MNDVMKIFEHEEFGKVRTLIIKGQPWFVGKDAAKILGYAKPRNAISVHVDNEDKKEALIQGPLGGTQKMIVINESGIYSLIMSSKLPKAKEFKHWITSDVLPTIRKYGFYATDDMLEEFLNDPDLAIGVFSKLKEEREKVKQLESENKKLAEKSQYLDLIEKGQTFKVILETLVDLGYCVEWLVHDSAGFGVPQSRKRVYLAGCLGNDCSRKILAFGNSDEENSRKVKQLIGGSQGQRVYAPDGLAVTQCSGSGGMGGKTGLYLIVDTDTGLPVFMGTLTSIPQE